MMILSVSKMIKRMNEHRRDVIKNHPLATLGLPLDGLNTLQWLCDAKSMSDLDEHVINDLGLPGIALME